MSKVATLILPLFITRCLAASISLNLDDDGMTLNYAHIHAQSYV